VIYEFGVRDETSKNTSWLQCGTSTLDILLKLEYAFILALRMEMPRSGLNNIQI
jgi:hypothetical protein